MTSYEELIKNLNVLLVDDDEDFINIAYVYLLSKGFKVEVINSGEEAIEVIKKRKHQIVLLDYFMPGMSGEEVVTAVREFNKEVIIIMQTGFAGQKPPIETMQKLNIQNYHDKTEGMDRLNLELISAVKILNQQNEIAISKYKSNAIGKLINSIAVDIKSNLMSIGAGIEVTNMLVCKNDKDCIEQNYDKLVSFYESNKSSLEKIDKILTAIINQSTNNSEDVITDSEVIENIELIVSSELKIRGIKLDAKKSLRGKSYLTGSINDVLFVICEIIHKLSETLQQNDVISFVLTEDENNWYFKIENDKIDSMNKHELFIFKNIVLSIKDSNIEYDSNSIVLSVKK
jgi:CheY-like chemotaxis protein